jgi:hypothetical protein
MKSHIIRMVDVVILSILVTGCSTTLNVTYSSDPPGAVLYQGEQRFGYTPTTLRYQVSEEDRKRGYALLQGTSVRWASGASANISSLRADFRIGLNQQFNFNRPDNYPGRETDVRFAIELERLAIMRRQAQAQEDQALYQLYNAINQQQQRQQPTIRNCTSTAFGNTVNTTCY